VRPRETQVNGFEEKLEETFLCTSTPCEEVGVWLSGTGWIARAHANKAGVKFINILRVAFLPIFFCKKQLNHNL
jgi:hypothetical protein